MNSHLEVVVRIGLLIILTFLANFATISADESKVYPVKSVKYIDDDGYNDEIIVVLGDNEVRLLIRWYTGVNFLVGDQVSILLKDNGTAEINGNTYDPLGENVYFLW